MWIRVGRDVLIFEVRSYVAWGGERAVPLSSKNLSRDKMCICCTTEHPRMGDFCAILFKYLFFIVTHKANYIHILHRYRCYGRFDFMWPMSYFY